MELLEQSVDPELEVGWERIKGNLNMNMFDDVVLDQAGLPETLKCVRIVSLSHLCIITKDCRYFQSVKARWEIAPGHDLQMFLVVDNECINSVLDTDADAMPFVLAQDVEYRQLENEEQEDEASYPGVFKVAIEALLSSLYVGLQGMGMAPEDLWPFADHVFQGTEMF